MSRHQMQTVNRDRRIILVGKTGNGKSSTANTILHKDAFTQEMSANAVTKNCTIKTGTDPTHNTRYRIVDTPGLFDTSKRVGQRALDIQQSIKICANPHVFLIVFSAKNRMTEEERYTIDMLRIIFGEKVFNHAIVVFTHGDSLDSDEEFKKFWTQNEHFYTLIKNCGGRVVKIENNHDHFNPNEGRERLVDLIEEFTHSGKEYYSYKHIDTHVSVIEEHLRNYQGKGNVHEDISNIVEQLGRKLDRHIWKIMLLGGALLGGGAMGMGYIAGAAGANAVVASGIGATVINNAATVGGAVVRTAGNVASSAATSRIGTALISNGANAGGAVVRTAWNVATNLRFW